MLLLILSPEQPENDRDVYLQPLIEELKYLLLDKDLWCFSK